MPPYPQTQTIGSSSAVAAELGEQLAVNLSLRLNPSMGPVDDSVLPFLKTVVSETLNPIMTSLLTDLIDPMLEPLGIRIGEAMVTVNSASQSCALSGYVYHDPSHKAARDGGESGCGIAVYVKLLRDGKAEQVTAADPSSGTYRFDAVAAGTYTLILGTDNGAADLTPRAPAGWIGTEAPDRVRDKVTIGTIELSNQNFGLYHGSRVSGTVFKDQGTNGGNANNGVQDGAEPGVAGVTVQATDAAGAAVLDRSLTAGDGDYVLWIPAQTGEIRIVESNQSGYLSTGGQPGTTGGSYDRTADAVIFTYTAGNRYTGVDFGDVPINRLLYEGMQSAAPGNVVFYPHEFIAGTRGQVSFAVTHVEQDWNAAVYREANCNGTLDAEEPLISAPVAATADERLCVIVKSIHPQRSSPALVIAVRCWPPSAMTTPISPRAKPVLMSPTSSVPTTAC